MPGHTNFCSKKRLGGINMAKNYSSSNKNSYGEDGYNSTNKNKNKFKYGG